MGDTNRNDEALGAIGTAFGKMLFAGSELAQRAAIETIETRAVRFLRVRGIDPAPWLTKARVEARARASGATYDPIACQLVTVSYVEALGDAVDQLARVGGAPR